VLKEILPRFARGICLASTAAALTRTSTKLPQASVWPVKRFMKLA
jgi:hypothetical protein